VTDAMLTSHPFLAPVFALHPAGYAVGRKHRRLALAIATVSFAIPMVLRASLTSPTGVRPFLVVFATVYAVGVTVVGAPLLVVGTSLARDRPEA
jgi:hypothetical protein